MYQTVNCEVVPVKPHKS